MRKDVRRLQELNTRIMTERIYYGWSWDGENFLESYKLALKHEAPGRFTLYALLNDGETIIIETGLYEINLKEEKYLSPEWVISQFIAEAIVTSDPMYAKIDESSRSSASKKANSKEVKSEKVEDRKAEKRNFKTKKVKAGKCKSKAVKPNHKKGTAEAKREMALDIKAFKSLLWDAESMVDQTIHAVAVSTAKETNIEVQNVKKLYLRNLDIEALRTGALEQQALGIDAEEIKKGLEKEITMQAIAALKPGVLKQKALGEKELQKMEGILKEEIRKQAEALAKPDLATLTNDKDDSEDKAKEIAKKKASERRWGNQAIMEVLTYESGILENVPNYRQHDFVDQELLKQYTPTGNPLSSTLSERGIYLTCKIA